MCKRMLLVSTLGALTSILFTTPASAECGFNTRKIVIDNPQIALEVGDTLNLVAHGGLGGGCDILNWPTSNPIPGHFNHDYPNPTAVANWGDGQSSALNIATDGTFTGSHKYTQPVPPGTALTIVLNGCAWNDIGQWCERVTNVCDNPGIRGGPWSPGQCEPHTATVSVFPAQPPSYGVITQRVTRAAISKGALAIALQDPSPASGMKVTVSSPTATLKFGDPTENPPVAPANPVVLVIPPGKYSFNFDIDATKVANPGNHQIDITSAGKTVLTDVAVH